MSSLQIGPLHIKSGQGTIIERFSDYKFADATEAQVSPLLGCPEDDVVAVQYVLCDVPEAKAVERHLYPGTRLGGLLSAWQFDPPEDHPDDVECSHLALLINDFRGINDDLDTVDGVLGGHFNTLLSWQPRIDPQRTALFALVAPGSRYQVHWRDRGAAPMLAGILQAHGYNGVILAGHRHDEEELEMLADFGTAMTDGAEIALMIASPSHRIAAPPFAMHFALTRDSVSNVDPGR